MSAGLLRLLLPAPLVVGGAAAGLAQTMPNRAAEYAAASGGCRPGRNPDDR